MAGQPCSFPPPPPSLLCVGHGDFVISHFSCLTNLSLICICAQLNAFLMLSSSNITSAAHSHHALASSSAANITNC
eukprot:1159961-Pelagomonas_calceolata.AAC.9